MDMSQAQLMNEMFQQKVATQEGRDKLNEYGGSWIRDRLREVSFFDKLVPPERVTRNDCQVSTETDTLVKIVSLEPQSRAMTLDFRGQPEVNMIRAPRMPVGFFTISSQKFEKHEQELQAYGDMPITKIIEDNSVKDMQEIKDREALLHVEAAVQALQEEANGAATALNNTSLQAGGPIEFSVIKGEMARASLGAPSANPFPMQRPDLTQLFKLLDGNRLRCERLLFTESDFDDILSWTVEDFGSKIQSETTVEGYKYQTLLGRPFIRTIKTDILRPGNVYAFTAPQFFAKSYILNDVKFYIDKIANLIMFQAWKDVGLAIVNVAAARKLELYSGDASSLDADGLIDQVIPKPEDQLGAVNNRVDSGLKFPDVSTY